MQEINFDFTEKSKEMRSSDINEIDPEHNFLLCNYNNDFETLEEIHDINRVELFLPLKPLKEDNLINFDNKLNNINNFNNGLMESRKKAIDIDLDKLSEGFDSRDLVKIFIYLFKNKIGLEGSFNTVTKSELSMKGIKFWETLARNPQFKFLFIKYKPWTLHTSYKRLFSHSTIEEVTELLIQDPKVDLNSLLKIFSKRKNITNNKLLKKKIKRQKSSSEEESDFEDNEITKSVKETNSFPISQDIVIDLTDEDKLCPNINKIKKQESKDKSNEQMKIDFKEEDITSLESKYVEFKEVLKSKNKLKNYFNSKIDFKREHLYLLRDLTTEKPVKDDLSDFFDNMNNTKINSIKNVDYHKFKDICYLTVLKEKDNDRIRKFYSKSIIVLDKEKVNLTFLVKDIKQEFNNKYDDNFIIESIMKVSNSESDLRLFLSDPIANQDLIWTEFDDKILTDEKLRQNDELLLKLIKLKGKDRVINRIKFLKLYISN